MVVLKYCPKECPKCGGEAGIGEHVGNGTFSDTKYFFVNCLQCMLSNEMIADMTKFDKQMAIEDWNDRRNFESK